MVTHPGQQTASGRNLNLTTAFCAAPDHCAIMKREAPGRFPHILKKKPRVATLPTIHDDEPSALALTSPAAVAPAISPAAAAAPAISPPLSAAAATTARQVQQAQMHAHALEQRYAQEQAQAQQQAVAAAALAQQHAAQQAAQQHAAHAASQAMQQPAGALASQASSSPEREMEEPRVEEEPSRAGLRYATNKEHEINLCNIVYVKQNLTTLM